MNTKVLTAATGGALIGIVFGYGLAAASNYPLGIARWLIHFVLGRPGEAVMFALIGAALAVGSVYLIGSRAPGSKSEKSEFERIDHAQHHRN